MEPTAPSDRELFLTLVEVRGPDQCWWWIGPLRHGLPDWEHSLPYRFAWERLGGNDPVAPGTWFERVEHDVDRACPGGKVCPHRMCVNPAHLRINPRREKQHGQDSHE